MARDIDSCQYRCRSILQSKMPDMSQPTVLETLRIVEAREVCCPPVLGGSLSDEDVLVAATIFKALGEPARVRIISSIAAAGSDGLCVCELMEPLGLSQPTVSHHLKVLYAAGLISREKRGTWAYYRLRDEALQVASSALRR
jgi:ArsR family transcriptional regulator